MEKIKVKTLSGLLLEGKTIKAGSILEVSEPDASQLVYRKVAEYVTRPRDKSLPNYRDFSHSKLRTLAEERNMRLPEEMERESLIHFLLMDDYYAEKNKEELEKLAKTRKIPIDDHLSRRDLIFLLIFYDGLYKGYENKREEELKASALSKKLPVKENTKKQELIKMLCVYDYLLKMDPPEFEKLLKKYKIERKENETRADLVLKFIALPAERTGP